MIDGIHGSGDLMAEVPRVGGVMTDNDASTCLLCQEPLPPSRVRVEDEDGIFRGHVCGTHALKDVVLHPEVKPRKGIPPGRRFWLTIGLAEDP